MEKKQLDKTEERRLSLLEIKINAKCKELGNTKSEVAQKIFFVSNTTFYRRLDPSKPLKPTVVTQLSAFLQEPEDIIVQLHNNIHDEQVLPLKEQHRSVNLHTRYGFCLVALLLVIFYFITDDIKEYLFTPKQDPYIAKYTGGGQDSDLSIVLDDFHSALYRYDFENLTVEITGDQIVVKCDVITSALRDPTLVYVGKFVSSGLYVEGRAALTYMIEVEANKEVWIGVMMLDLPLSGQARGYWLTIHNDFDLSSEGKFAVGTAKLDRDTFTAHQ